MVNFNELGDSPILEILITFTRISEIRETSAPQLTQNTHKAQSLHTIFQQKSGDAQ